MDLTDDMQQQAQALADPSRFRLFGYIDRADGPIGVGELTEMMGFNHNAVRQHLAVLVAAGLVAETTERRSTRGRPRKQYTARADALSAFRSVSGAYERLASLLLQVASGSSPYDVGFAEANTETGTEVGTVENPGDAVQHLQDGLTTEGFEPERTSANELLLTHCPFAGTAAKNQDIVCELHRGLIDGRLAATGHELSTTLTPTDPHEAACSVIIYSID